MSSLSSGGGGGAIYDVGEEVSEQLESGESLTVPSGETWVVTITIYATNNAGELKINSTQVFSTPGGKTGGKSDAVLTAGDTVFVKRGGNISGWAL